MGVIRTTVCMEAEVEDLRRALLLGGTDAAARAGGGGGAIKGAAVAVAEDESRGMPVCVTSGVSFLGFALARRLLARGYAVRLALDTQEDLDKVREMDMFMETGTDGVWAVVANMMDIDSLCHAFSGCVAVFHTSSFADPSGLSGYTKHMAENEAKVAERVIEACARTDSVTKCVFTSSLLACIWRRNSPLNRRLSIDENCWSDENLCRDKKLWFALGKTMAEKAAWRAARGRELKLVTLCPALLTGPGFRRRNSTASIAYLKGCQEMFADSLLATVDVGKVADAHVRVYEEMSGTACGRYICFDRIITREAEGIELEQQLGLQSRIANTATTSDRSNLIELSNRKLSRLISTSRRCSYDVYMIHK